MNRCLKSTTGCQQDTWTTVALIWAKIFSQEDERGSESNDIPLTDTDSSAYIEL